MRTKKRLYAVLLVLSMFVLLAVGAFAADGTGGTADDVRFTKKVVSVLYDNSGSMNYDEEDSSDTDNGYPSKNDYAVYAIQMLMSLLGEEDRLIITPMNNYSPFEVDLAASDRNAEIKNAADFLAGSIGGGTPSESIKSAVNQLVSLGLQSRDNLANEDSNIEYWVVIFTDGAFNYGVDSEAAIRKYIDAYPSLHTIYLGFVDAPDLGGSSLSNEYKFTSYTAKNPDTIVDVMQDIANQMSGRYTLPSAAYKIDGNKVTVNLDSYEYSFKNVSVIAQNCGASINSVTYSLGNVSVSQSCSITPYEELAKIGMQAGCSAVIKGDPYLYGGELTIEFSSPVTDVAILAEPALAIVHYFEYSDGGEYKRVDMQYINSNLSDEDSIRVGYEVYERAKGTQIDLDKLFGDVETKVTYAGNSYVCGEDFPLVVGINDIGVSVSVMSGKYTMYSSETCIVESDPTYYRIDAGDVSISAGANPQFVSEYTVYVDNRPIDSNLLKNGTYALEYKLTAPDGSSVEDAVPKISDNGKLVITKNLKFGEYGEYEEWVKVTSPEGITREQTRTVAYVPASLTLNVIENGELTMTEHQLSKNESTVKFELSADGVPISFDGSVVAYSLTVNGVDVTAYTGTESNMLSYTPSSSTLSTVPILQGDMDIELSVSLCTDASVSASAKSHISVESSSYSVENVSSPSKSVDRFALDDSQAVLYFRILRDGEQVGANDMQNLYSVGEITASDTGTFSKYFWLPCGLDVSFEEQSGGGVIAVRVVRDMPNPIQTFAAMLILNGEKTITVTCRGSEAQDSFDFAASNLWSYIWRILVILLIIHTILFLIGFIVCKNFVSGTYLRIRLPDDDSSKIGVSTKPVNLTFGEKWGWHFKRFIFMLPVLANQTGDIAFGKIEYKFTRGKEKDQIRFIRDMRSLEYTKMGNEAGLLYEAYLKEFRSKKYMGGTPRVKDSITAGAVRTMYRGNDVGAKVQNKECNLTQTPYGFYDSDNKLKEIIMFIRRKQ